MTQETAATCTPESTQFVERMNTEALCISALSKAFDEAVAQFGAARLAQCFRDTVPA